MVSWRSAMNATLSLVPTPSAEKTRAESAEITDHVRGESLAYQISKLRLNSVCVIGIDPRAAVLAIFHRLFLEKLVTVNLKFKLQTEILSRSPADHHARKEYLEIFHNLRDRGVNRDFQRCLLVDFINS
jgi:hypothetical protein